ncbi:MAG: DUF1990 family protein [Candidatus Xenobia bacterium]
MQLVFGSKTSLGPLQSRQPPAVLLKNRMKNAERDVWEEQVGREKPGDPMPNGPFEKIAQAIVAADLYPRTVAQTVVDRRPVREGDTIGILYRVLPGINVYYGIRITQCFSENSGGLSKRGIRFQTLEGHPEVAEGYFSVEKDYKSGQVKILLGTWSQPGGALAKVLYPIARMFQGETSKASLRHLRSCAS